LLAVAFFRLNQVVGLARLALFGLLFVLRAHFEVLLARLLRLLLLRLHWRVHDVFVLHLAEVHLLGA